MLWVKGVKILFATSFVLIVGFCIALINHECGWAVLCGLLALLFACVAQRRFRQLCEYEEPYKNVRFFCVNEFPNVWSTHIGGRPERFFVQLWRRTTGLLSSKSSRLTRMKLALQPDDRMEVRRRSLACFVNKLDQLEGVNNSALITASILNDTDRGGRRLQERIDAINKRPQWRYQLIERRLGFFDALIGRIFYGWQFSKKNEFWRPYVPGLIAWRRSDEMPDLKKLNARHPEIYDFSSLTAKASTTSAIHELHCSSRLCSTAD